MNDSHKKHTHTTAHWGQAFEIDHHKEDEVVEDSIPLESVVTEEVKQPNPSVVKGETSVPIIPFNDPAQLEQLYREGLALLKLEDSSLKGYVKQLFKKKPHYETVGTVFTQAGRELFIVMDQRGEKFARYDLYGKSDHARTPSTMRSAYLPFKKVEPYLRK